MQKQGWTLVDVRVASNFEKDHIAGSINIPLYRDVQGNRAVDNLKRLAMASFAMRATERDPDFADNVVERLGKDTKIMVVRLAQLICVLRPAMGCRQCN